MSEFNYFEEVENPVTVCDTEGIILYMNKASRAMLSKYGSDNLVGKSLYGCHNPNSNEIIKRLITNKESNTYFTLKNGVRKLVNQIPWYKNGEMAGLIETVMIIPEGTPTLERK